MAEGHLQLRPTGEILVLGSLKAEAEHRGATLATAGGQGPVACSSQHHGHPTASSPRRPADARDPGQRDSCCSQGETAPASPRPNSAPSCV